MTPESGTNNGRLRTDFNQRGNGLNNEGKIDRRKLKAVAYTPASPSELTPLRIHYYLNRPRFPSDLEPAHEVDENTIQRASNIVLKELLTGSPLRSTLRVLAQKRQISEEWIGDYEYLCNLALEIVTTIYESGLLGPGETPIARLKKLSADVLQQSGEFGRRP